MPDMKTALSKMLDEWEKEEEITNQTENQVKHLFKPTNNVTRSTFNMIRDNPGITKKEAVQKLNTANFNPASTSSLIAQMLKQRLVRDEGGKLYANFAEYVPLKSNAQIVGKDKPKAKRMTKAFKEAVEIIKAKPIEAAPQPQARQERRVMDIEEWLNEVPLMQARMVYVKLKAIFEGEGK